MTKYYIIYINGLCIIVLNCLHLSYTFKIIFIELVKIMILNAMCPT